jgi:ABC-type lipoprotein release transport system permease subunit
MDRVIAVADRAFAHDPNAVGDSVIQLPVQRPAEIVNYQSTGGTPEVLASGLAVGAVVALTVALVGTVRKRRQDLALLKTLGFTKSQLAVTLAWQATATAVVGIIIGVPLGIAAGRQLWDLFAESIDAVPQPSVPLSVIFVAIGALVLANLVAALPGRSAAATPATIILRGE